ncbi:MAG: sigma-70 family RNA polymerase sigma factor [Bacteroidales bacterium]|jgi:RNA polymerase sigma factor (sigma-70 family)|nr:sigma-70 family RNA polymerase sigma factor [Bacteroidales bacterium]
MNANTFKIKVLPLNAKLYGFAIYILNNIPEAEDIVQDVFIKLWNMRNKLDTYKNIEAIAMSITKNLCIDKIRRRRTVSLEEKHINKNIEEQNFSENETEQNILIRKIHNAIERLPNQQHVIMQLKDIEGYDYEEISQIMQMNINSIRVCVSRARKRLREIIIKSNYEGAEKNKQIISKIL